MGRQNNFIAVPSAVKYKWLQQMLPWKFNSDFLFQLQAYNFLVRLALLAVVCYPDFFNNLTEDMAVVP